MDRTLRAALVAAAIGLVAVGGLGTFLGFDPVGSLVAGLIAGLLAAALIWGAARRAESFEATPPSPRFPGPPDPEDPPPRDGDPGDAGSAGDDAPRA